MHKKPSGMIKIPSGTFKIGSDNYLNESPVTEVFLDSYWIDETPVTNQMFSEFINAGGYSDASFWTTEGWDFLQKTQVTEPNYWNDLAWNSPDSPVTGVSFWEALAFAQYAQKSLPTEAQWEYAAKGPTNREFPWGDTYPTLEHANFAPGCVPIERKSTSVLSHPSGRSYFGCWDMAGNVAEWCLDHYSSSYLHKPGVSNPLYISSEAESTYVVRGGSWLFNELYLQCTSRDHYGPGLRDNIVGFRCVINIQSENQL